MSYLSDTASTEAPPAVAGVIVVRRGEKEVFQVLEHNFEVCVIWDRRLAERRVSCQPVTRDGRDTERRSPPPLTWDAYGFLLAPSPPSGL